MVDVVKVARQEAAKWYRWSHYYLQQYAASNDPYWLYDAGFAQAVGNSTILCVVDTRTREQMSTVGALHTRALVRLTS